MSSAFRPISDPGSSMRIYQAPSDSVVKPKALKYQKSQQQQQQSRSNRDGSKSSSLDKNKSSSLHDLLVDDNSLQNSGNSSRVKSRSQEDLLNHKREFTIAPSPPPVPQQEEAADEVSSSSETVDDTKPPSRSQKQTVIHVKSLESSTDDEPPVFQRSRPISSGLKYKSKSTFMMNRKGSSDGNSKSRDESMFSLNNGHLVQQQNVKRPVIRQDSVSSGSSNQSAEARLSTARSESYLASLPGDMTPKMPNTAQHYRGSFYAQKVVPAKQIIGFLIIAVKNKFTLSV